MPKTCVFLDGGYLQKVLEKDFNKPRLDFGRVGPYLSQGFEPFLRTYYYNCLPYQSATPTEEEKRLFGKAQGFYDALKKISNFQLRMGRLEFRGVDQRTGKRVFEQKRVDVQLAVDLLTLAFSKQIATAIVIAGDSDFIPVFQAAKDQGVRLVLYHGKNNPAHRDLAATADQRIVLDDAFIKSVESA